LIRALNTARLRRLVTENLWLVTGALISVVGSLALVRVLTQYLNPSQYGELALALTVANLINQVVMCGLISGIGRFYSIAKDHADLHGYLAQSYGLLKYAAIATFFIGVFLLVGVGLSTHTNWTMLVCITIVFSVVTNYNGVFGDIQNAARNRSIVVLNNSLDTVLKIVIAYVATMALGASSTIVMLGYTLAALVVFISNKILLKNAIPQSNIKKFTQTEKPQNWQKKIWAYAWPFSAWGIFTWSQQASDRWALQVFSTTEEVGVFAVLFQLGYAPIVMLSGLLSGFLTPIFFSRAGDATDQARIMSVHRINLLVSYTLLALSTAAFCVTWWLHSFIFTIFVSPEFRGHSYLLPWFVLAGGLFSTGQMLVLKILSEVRSRILLTLKIGTALLGVTFNILGAWIGGINGVVVALVIFSSIYLLGMMWMTNSSPSTATE
jgi:O-antigen/teichoic acid export membrane protein